MSTKRETKYQSDLIKRLEREFPGCMVIINDPSRIQGIPDLLVLFGNGWVALEVKISQDAPIEPNQTHYITRLDEMSYAAFIYPENEERIFDELQSTFSNYR